MSSKGAASSSRREQGLSGSPSIEPAQQVRVVMAVRDVGSFLPSAVNAILAQLNEKDEMVIVDDASSDDSYEWLLETAARNPAITVLRNDRRLGAPAGLNKAILHGDCPYYVAIADGDDVTLPGRLSAQLRFLADHPDYGAVSSEGRYIGPTDRVFGRMSVGPKSEDDFNDLVARGEVLLIPHPAATFRRDALIQAGLYDSSFACGIDVDIINRVVYSAGWKVKTLDDIHFLYRLRSDQTSFARFSDQRMIVRYIRYRNGSTLRGEPSPNYDAWREMVDRGSARSRFKRWRYDRGALRYRKAGLALLMGQRPRALVYLLSASILHPRWVLMKLILLFGLRSPGSVDPDARLFRKQKA